MKRLTARTKNGHAYLVNVKPDEQEVESPYKNTLQCILDCFDRLAAYEDAEEQGLLVRLPCKVGETVWYIPQYGGKPYCGAKEGHAQHITLSSRHWRIQVREHHPHNTDFVLGKTVFLTREEAEAALKGGTT
jgi:hypothetical protein